MWRRRNSNTIRRATYCKCYWCIWEERHRVKGGRLSNDVGRRTRIRADTETSIKKVPLPLKQWEKIRSAGKV